MGQGANQEVPVPERVSETLDEFLQVRAHLTKR
jgi:hypothetical protein